MIDAELFLGFPKDEKFDALLKEVGQKKAALFLSGSEEYLKKVKIEGVPYIGKTLGKRTDFEALSVAGAHIRSVVEMFLPSYPVKQLSLTLHSLPLSSS